MVSIPGECEALVLVVFSIIIYYLFISFIINEVILTAFRIIFSTWFYNLLGPGHTYNQVHTSTLQPTHWASINSAIVSTQSSVCASGNDTYAYIHRQGSLTGIRKQHNLHTKSKVSYIGSIYCRCDVSLKISLCMS